MLVTLSPGLYTMVVPDGHGSGTVLAEVYDADAAASRLTSLSARAQVSDSAQLIAGLTVDGDVPRRVLVRGVGPGLTNYGVAGVLSNPVISVYDAQNRLLAQNDDWQTPVTVNAAYAATSVADILTASGITFALAPGSKDSALIVTLAPGTYTIIVGGANGSAGTAMVEVYDLSP
jgi:hypothetical protein